MTYDISVFFDFWKDWIASGENVQWKTYNTF